MNDAIDTPKTEMIARAIQSAHIDRLADALAVAQGMFEHAKKSVDNTFFKSKYADLASVIDAAKKPLSDNGLAVLQVTEVGPDGKLFLVTTLAHKSGQWMRSWYPVVPVKNDPQAMGSALTYARRYSFGAITGIASDEDDDGNAASGRNGKNGQIPIIDTDKAVEIDLLIAEVKADKPKFLQYMGVDDVRNIRAVDYDKAVAALNAKKQGAA